LQKKEEKPSRPPNWGGGDQRERGIWRSAGRGGGGEKVDSFWAQKESTNQEKKKRGDDAVPVEEKGSSRSISRKKKGPSSTQTATGRGKREGVSPQNESKRKDHPPILGKKSRSPTWKKGREAHVHTQGRSSRRRYSVAGTRAPNRTERKRTQPIVRKSRPLLWEKGEGAIRITTGWKFQGNSEKKEADTSRPEKKKKAGEGEATPDAASSQEARGILEDDLKGKPSAERKGFLAALGKKSEQPERRGGRESYIAILIRKRYNSGGDGKGEQKESNSLPPVKKKKKGFRKKKGNSQKSYAFGQTRGKKKKKEVFFSCGYEGRGDDLDSVSAAKRRKKKGRPRPGAAIASSKKRNFAEKGGTKKKKNV